MMLEITALPSGGITLFPEGVVQEITQNIQVILTTCLGTVPLDRSFGINPAFLDFPIPAAMMKARILILETIRDNEPRVEVMTIDFIDVGAIDGKMAAKVKVRIKGEYANG